MTWWLRERSVRWSPGDQKVSIEGCKRLLIGVKCLLSASKARRRRSEREKGGSERLARGLKKAAVSCRTFEKGLEKGMSKKKKRIEPALKPKRRTSAPTRQSKNGTHEQPRNDTSQATKHPQSRHADQSKAHQAGKSQAKAQTPDRTRHRPTTPATPHQALTRHRPESHATTPSTTNPLPSHKAPPSKSELRPTRAAARGKRQAPGSPPGAPQGPKRREGARVKRRLAPGRAGAKIKRPAARPKHKNGEAKLNGVTFSPSSRKVPTGKRQANLKGAATPGGWGTPKHQQRTRAKPGRDTSQQSPTFARTTRQGGWRGLGWSASDSQTLVGLAMRGRGGGPPKEPVMDGGARRERAE